MSFADEEFLPSGAYVIVNAKYNHRISFTDRLSTSSDDYGWFITFLGNKKWTIQGASGAFLDIASDPKEGDDVASAQNPPKPHQFVIERRPETAQLYTIYSPSKPEFVWSLMGGDEGMTPRISSASRGCQKSLWKFKKIKILPGDGKEDLKTENPPEGPHSSRSPLLYYRVYTKEGAIPTKRPAYENDPYIGRIKSKWIAPPRNARSLRLCLSTMENIGPVETHLFGTSSSKVPLVDDLSLSLKGDGVLGVQPREPLMLLSEGIPDDGLKPGTESLHIPPDAQSPVAPQFLYYGMYTEGGASASMAPVDPEEPWVSRLDIELIPPPRTAISLRRVISAKEGITGFSQLFLDDEATTPLGDDDFLMKPERWPGPTAEDHVMFKSASEVSTKSCTGFPSGNFRICAPGGGNCYWTMNNFDTNGEGNFIVLFEHVDRPAQLFFVNSMGNLCSSDGAKLDVMDNSVIITHDRQRTEPWPNPWSHPLPTFSYSKESKIMTVKFYADPLVSVQWPRAESAWKDREFVLAARCALSTQCAKFQKIAKWAGRSAQPTWTTETQCFNPGHEQGLGVEEKGKILGPQDLDRMKWEIEPA